MKEPTLWTPGGRALQAEGMVRERAVGRIQLGINEQGGLCDHREVVEGRR